MKDEERQALIQEGQNQVLYLLLALGDENVAHDNWHPDRTTVLVSARQEIVQRLKHPTPDGAMNIVWPRLLADGSRDWPDFETYLCRAG